MRVTAYHGSPAKFTQIRESATGGRFAELAVPHDGIWFTEDFDEARWYAGKRGYVYTARLRLRWPLRYPRGNFADEGLGDLPDLHHLKRDGYDSLVVERGEWAEGYPLRMVELPTHYAVFDARQVKLIEASRVPA